MNTIALEPYETGQYFAALSLAGWGFEVFPCGELARHPQGHPREGKPVYRYGAPVIKSFDGKEPLTGLGGHKHATTDEPQVQQWWMKWPTANIGCRPPVYAVVLDVDVRSGGLDTWAELNRGHILPHTLVTETGTGGLHVWFRLPYRGELNKYAGQGIDIKHHGGYLVMPGSIHPDTGNQYVCISWCPPEELPELPAHLRRHVYKPAKPARPVLPKNMIKKGDGGHLVNKLLDAQPGTRNDTLNDVFFQAYSFGYEHRVPELLDAAEAIGLDATEIEQTHRSAQNAAEQKVA